MFENKYLIFLPGLTSGAGSVGVLLFAESALLAPEVEMSRVRGQSPPAPGGPPPPFCGAGADMPVCRVGCAEGG